MVMLIRRMTRACGGSSLYHGASSCAAGTQVVFVGALATPAAN